MPPINSFTYRVLFYFTTYRTPEEFWKNEGKDWSKEKDKFINPGRVVKAAIDEITVPSDTQDQKLRKLYAAVMQLENTSFTRERTKGEEKSEGLNESHNADDIWTRKRGSRNDLAKLFVAMARAAGMKAYLANITSRDQSLFAKSYFSLSQLNDDVAIVNVDGKEQFFDPGSRYCPYGHLAWMHTLAGGIRQTEGGTDFVTTPASPYTYSRVLRVANLAVDTQGAVSGSIVMTYLGDAGLRWRQTFLKGDPASLNRELRTSVENLMPPRVEVNVASIEQLGEYEKPFVVTFDVTGVLGSTTGKRLLLPGDIFEGGAKPSFPNQKRDIPVYFKYSHAVQDAVRIKFPGSFTVESLPASDKSMFEKAIAYSINAESTAATVTIRRDYILGEIVYAPVQYASLRTFYSRMENKDQESVILTTAPVKTGKPAATGN